MPHCAKSRQSAEAFLDKGAAVYIGATENSYTDANNYAAREFFNDWIDSPDSIGWALRNLKKHLGACEAIDEFWSLEYQLYGDPKYGAMDGGHGFTSCSPLGEVPPASSCNITVPDYVVTTVNGIDYVRIPGGYMLLVKGKPLVPTYSISLDYPKGYKIHDVILTQRGNLSTATGLNISNTILEPDSAKVGNPAPDGGEGWYPEKAFGWTISDEAEDTTTLVITVYPFYYNSKTTDVEFYKSYSFDIQYTASPVEIGVLQTGRATYKPGQTIGADVCLTRSSQTPIDVIIDATIRTGDGDIIAGLPLRTLKG